jgi:oligopeptide/dipeptide ABC transporter ATP-binding protein
MKTVLKTEHLNKVYSLGSLLHGLKINALDDVNLEIKSENPVIISLVGESGSGKTTLARVMLRLIQPNTGDAIVYDRIVAGPGEREPKAEFLKSVQPIFQNPFEAFSSYRSVDSYLNSTAVRVNKFSGAQAIEVTRDMLNFVGLNYGDVRGKYPNQFSGGELQRVSIARALIPRPNMIIADEPVSMIDASMRMNIVNLFLSLKQEFKTSFLYITHDLATAYYISDYVAVMYRGCIVEFGAAKDVLKNPLHPYTRLLLESIPSLKVKWNRTQFANSDIETKEYQFEGCKYRNRCPLAQEICTQQRPRVTKKEGGREVYCHFA